MSDIGSIQAQDGSYEEFGFTLLDIVKHALNTVVDNLDEGDKMSIVTFND